MNIGDYVRSSEGLIAKIINIEEKNEYKVLEFDNDICFLVDIIDNKIFKDRRSKYLPLTEHIDINKIKHSSNIIDLIEVGDYVNGIRVDEIKNGQLKTASYYDGYICHLCNDNEIKSIVTKEQFKSMEYKLED